MLPLEKGGNFIFLCALVGRFGDPEREQVMNIDRKLMGDRSGKENINDRETVKI